MAIAFVAAAVLATGTRTTSTVNMPAGVVSGHEVRIALTAGVSGGTAPTITPPGTATLVTSVTYGDGGFTVRHSVYRYRATGSDPGSFAFTHASVATDGVSAAWSGVDATSADDASPTTNSATTGTTATATGLTTVTADALLVAVRGSWDGNAITPPAGWTERGDQLIQWMGELAQPSAGPTGNIAIPHGNGGNSSPWGAILMALRPAAVGPPEEGPRNSDGMHMMGPSYY